MSEQWVHVVRFATREDGGTLSVHSTRKQGLVAALQAIAESVEYDWSDFPEDMLREFACLCSIDDEGSLDNALRYWNKKLSRADPNRGFEDFFEVYVSIEQVEADDVPLDMELPDFS